MSCENFQLRLLAGEVSTEERDEHLRKCQECGKYVTVLDMMQSHCIPDELDRRVRKMCRRELQRVARRQSNRWFSFAACAAALFAALALVGVMHTNTTVKSVTEVDNADMSFETGLLMAEEENGVIEFELELIASGM